MTDIQAILLPCPFCGGEARSGEYWPTWDIRENNAWCYAECGASVVRKTEAEAITAWNTRAPVAAPTGDALGALENSLEIIGQYKSDLLWPPTGDSLERRVKYASAGIDTVRHAIATLTGKETT